jgi:hypothetical protein
MLAEVRLIILPREAKLTISRGDEIVDEELWTFDRQIGRSEAQEFARAVFDDAYDGVNYMVHGED